MTKLTFEDDGAGWRLLDIARNDEEAISISIDTALEGPKRSAFIAIHEGSDYAAFHLSIKKLRKIAKAILNEVGE